MLIKKHIHLVFNKNAMWLYICQICLSIILKLPFFILDLQLLKVQAHLILERNSLFIDIFFLIVCIVSQKPPFFSIL